MSDWKYLPLTFDDYEMKGEWRRCIKREGTVGELAEQGMWDVDDPTDTAEMTQVLRLLRDQMQRHAALVEAAKAHVKAMRDMPVPNFDSLNELEAKLEASDE